MQFISHIQMGYYGPNKPRLFLAKQKPSSNNNTEAILEVILARAFELEIRVVPSPARVILASLTFFQLSVFVCLMFWRAGSDQGASFSRSCWILPTYDHSFVGQLKHCYDRVEKSLLKPPLIAIKNISFSKHPEDQFRPWCLRLGWGYWVLGLLRLQKDLVWC